MAVLAAVAAIWMLIHLGIAGTKVRTGLAARLGERGFTLAFSVLSVATLAGLVVAYDHAPEQPLWFAPDWLRWLLAFVMLAACVLFVGSLAAPNPTAVGGPALGSAPRGLTLVTRHPMLWAFALWGAVHVLGNGDLASLLFFGAFVVTALAGMPSIDMKLGARDPAGWSTLAAQTSIIPFVAMAQGRARPRLADIGWLVPVGGVVLWLVLLFGHRHVIGVSPVPG